MQPGGNQLLQRRLHRLGNALVIAVFLGGLLLPLLHGTEPDDPDTARREMRDLAPAPQWPHTLAQLEAFPAAFEHYWDDHFGLRRRLIRAYMILKGKWLGVSPSSRVVLGQDGWIYFTKDRLFEDYRGEIIVPQWELVQWRKALEDRRRWLAERGATYLFAMAPNKVTIHPEHLPPRMRVDRPVRRRIDQIEDELAQHSDFRIVDLRPPLRQLAQTQNAFLVTDSHWTLEGAFTGYQTVMQALVAAGVPKPPLPRSAFKLAVWPTLGDLAHMLTDLEYPEEQKQFLQPIEPLPCKKIELGPELQSAPPSWHMWEPPTAYECEGQEGVLLMFKDSYAYYEMPWFACHFRYSFFLSMSPYDLESLQVLVPALHPTVVIEQRAERNMAGTPQRLYRD